MHKVHALSLWVQNAGALLNGCNAILADTALGQALRGWGSQAWCLQPTDAQKLQLHLAYLTSHRTLPISTIRSVQKCFALTQVGHS